MSDELFDVVDSNDNVLRQELRSVVHRDKLTHRAVHIFVFRTDGRMVIHKRSDNKEEFPSVWTSSASGHVSAGEDYDETAPRELTEELGISPALERLQKFAACPDTCFEHTVLYRATCDEELRIDRLEIAAVDTVSLVELQSRVSSTPDNFSPAFRLLFDWFMHAERQTPGD